MLQGECGGTAGRAAANDENTLLSSHCVYRLSPDRLSQYVPMPKHNHKKPMLLTTAVIARGEVQSIRKKLLAVQLTPPDASAGGN